MSYRSGRHFLQIPGPTNVPDRVLRALAAPTIDHRGPEFAALARSVLSGLKPVFRTTGPVVAFPASGTGAWEAALVNTLSPGDRVIAFDTGHFAGLWSRMAGSLGLEVDLVPGSWRRGVDPALVHERLATDRTHAVRAVMVVHNETSTGVTSDVPAIRAAVDAAGHPALLLVDTVSSLASIDYRHDEWGVDVTVSCSQKGLMLPPGLGFNALGERALAASASAGLPRSYWDWQPMLAANADGHFPYTPPTNLLYGLREALAMLTEEGLENVLARHRRHAEATRLAVRAWGWRSCARTQPGTPARSRPCWSVPATTPTRSGGWRSNATTCRSARASAASPDACSASATSGRSTTSCSPEHSAGLSSASRVPGWAPAAASTPPSPTCAETEAAPLMPAAALPTPPSPGRGRRRQAGRRAGRRRGGRARWCRSAGAHRAYRAASRCG